MARVYNLLRRLTDERRFSKDGKIALATYLGIKMAHVNSFHRGIRIKDIRGFFGVGYAMAKRILRVMREDAELFTINEKKNCVFANSCKSDEIKISKGKNKLEYRGDDVIKLDIPECYLDKGRLSFKELVLFVDRLVILKEYDKGFGYKFKCEVDETKKDCEKEKPKSQTYVSKSTGICRTTLLRRLKSYVEDGTLRKLSERHLERTTANDPKGFRAINKKTRMPYFLRCIPAEYSVNATDVLFTHLIWTAPARLLARQVTLQSAYFELERRQMYD